VIKLATDIEVVQVVSTDQSVDALALQVLLAARFLMWGLTRTEASGHLHRVNLPVKQVPEYPAKRWLVHLHRPFRHCGLQLKKRLLKAKASGVVVKPLPSRLSKTPRGQLPSQRQIWG
jgi:hypothetical protein